jgi:hypothetical protein
MTNYALAYRPLRASTGIFNPATNDSGTLGFFGRDTMGAPWMISCHHVLIASATHPQKIYQLADTDVEDWVAETDPVRADAELDIAAARIRAGVEVVEEIAGLGPIGPVAPPFVGMRVFKVGVRTGLTEGVIATVGPLRIEIVPASTHPLGYQLSDRGDSGSLWIQQRTLSPVALHYQGNIAGGEMAYARPLSLVLSTLALSM